MINYDKIPNGYVELLEYLGGESPSEHEIWCIARGYEDYPCFEEIFVAEVFKRIRDIVEEQYSMEVTWSIFGDAVAVQLFVNGVEVCDVPVFKATVNKEIALLKECLEFFNSIPNHTTPMKEGGTYALASRIEKFLKEELR